MAGLADATSHSAESLFARVHGEMWAYSFLRREDSTTGSLWYLPRREKMQRASTWAKGNKMNVVGKQRHPHTW